MIFLVSILRNGFNNPLKLGAFLAVLALFALTPSADTGGINHKALFDPQGHLSQVVYFNGNGAVTQYHEYLQGQKGVSVLREIVFVHKDGIEKIHEFGEVNGKPSLLRVTYFDAYEEPTHILEFTDV